MLAPRFFIYVPEESLDEATRPAAAVQHSLHRLRAYYYNARNQFVVARGWRVQQRKRAAGEPGSP